MVRGTTGNLPKLFIIYPVCQISLNIIHCLIQSVNPFHLSYPSFLCDMLILAASILFCPLFSCTKKRGHPYQNCRGHRCKWLPIYTCGPCRFSHDDLYIVNRAYSAIPSSVLHICHCPPQNTYDGRYGTAPTQNSGSCHTYISLCTVYTDHCRR